MKPKVRAFDEKLFKRCEMELRKKPAKEIILFYKQKCGLNVYSPNFLSQYYSPILTALKQFFNSLQNKRILEIGHRLPMFLDYLEKQEGAIGYGIDTEPGMITKSSLKMSVENITPQFFMEHEHGFDAIVARITLSRLYDEMYFLETGHRRFKDKEKILLNLHRLLKPKGILVLQDDRGTIFTESQFAKVGFEKILRETPIIFKDRRGKNFGWNVLVVYQKFKPPSICSPTDTLSSALKSAKRTS